MTVPPLAWPGHTGCQPRAPSCSIGLCHVVTGDARPGRVPQGLPAMVIPAQPKTTSPLWLPSYEVIGWL